MARPRAECLAEGQPATTRTPLLANIDLHWFEELFHRETGPAHWANARLVRCADDFVVLARYQGDRLITWVERTLEDRFKLTINRDKTRVVNLDKPCESLSFLGFTFRYDRDLQGRDHRYLNVFPSKKALARLRENLRELLSRNPVTPLPTLIALVNRKLRGWKAYFSHGDPRVAFREVNRYVVELLTQHLQRRSQRPFRPPEGQSFYAQLQCLGLRL